MALLNTLMSHWGIASKARTLGIRALTGIAKGTDFDGFNPGILSKFHFACFVPNIIGWTDLRCL